MSLTRLHPYPGPYPGRLCAPLLHSMLAKNVQNRHIYKSLYLKSVEHLTDDGVRFKACNQKTLDCCSIVLQCLQ